MSKITINTMLLFFFIGITSTLKAQIYYDSFESQNMSTTNSDGFSWGNNNRTSVVTQHATDGPVAVYNNGSIYNIAAPFMNDGTVRDWTAFDGDYSLRFRYPADENWAEQRYDLGGAYPELWISFWLRVPTNFLHGTGSSTNNKLFALWMDGYEGSGQGATSVWEFWPNGSGGSVIAQRYRNEANAFNSGHQNHMPFIEYPNDQGRWMQLVFYIKAETTNNANDGIMKLWRKWENGTFEQLHDWNNLDLHVPVSPNGFSAGYLMGWSNPTYANDTEWLLDGFTVSNTSLLDSSLSINDEIFNNTISITPNPTANIFTIDLGNEILEKVVIYNELGQKIKEIPIVSETNQVDVSNLSNGIYFVKITFQSGKTATKKIIKN